MLSYNLKKTLTGMADRMKDIRINQLRIKQSEMALRMRVSRKTYIKMENADESVSLKSWLLAAEICLHLTDFDLLFKPKSLFDLVPEKEGRKRVR